MSAPWKLFAGLLLLGAAVATAAPIKPKQQEQQEKRAKKEPASATLVQFAGNQELSEDDLNAALADELSIVKQQGLSKASADDAAFYVEHHYKELGYADAAVSWKIVPGPRPLLLTISEGPLTALGDVKFAGNAHIPSDELHDYLIGPTRERFSRLRMTLPYVEESIDEGVNLVRRHYVAQGYRDVVIPPAKVAISADHKTANVTVNIQEGPAYAFGRVDFTGDLGGVTESKIRQDLAEDLKKPYSEAQLLALQRRVESYYKNAGYFEAKAAAEAEKADSGHRVPIRVKVAAGDVYTFDGVKVNGLSRMDPQFMRDRFAKLSGKTYSPDSLDEVYREVVNTGLFEDLRVNAKPIAGKQLRLEVDAKEAKPRSVGFYVGYNTFDGGIAGVEYRDLNLFNTGRPITLRGEYSFRGFTGEALYEDPWLFETDYKLRMRLYAETKDRDDYTTLIYGFRPEISRKITKHWEMTAFLDGRHVTIEDSQIDPAVLGPDDYTVNSAGISETLDYRDNPTNPKTGFIGTIALSAASDALGSDVQLARGTYRASYYIPIGPTTLALGTQGGIVEPINGDPDLPIEERFFIGGSTTVRSFPERKMGPRDRFGHFIGGRSYQVFNVEETFPLFGDLKGAVFFDAGVLRRREHDFGYDDMRYAVGPGLRYELPIGAMRLDYGFNPDERADEPSGTLHFSFGVAF
ncbi:MAG: BamA/TamA family outer membrane protein [Verrucomicrobiae bacterium]|nr:BamA/TamA family outer membrane protein [Verrucomicrobiae bacterium]